MKIAAIGCGPAGLAAALVIEKQGHDVSLFERFETPRPIGSGIILQPTGLCVLEELGVLAAISPVGQRIDHIVGITMPASKKVLDVNYAALGAEVHGLAIHRAALFDVLFDRVLENRLPIHTGIDVAAIRQSPDGIYLKDADAQEYGPFDLVIDASGANTQLHKYAASSVRSRVLTYGAVWGAFDWTGAPFQSKALEQRYVGAHTMIGVLPIGQHRHAARDQVAFVWSLRWREYGAWLDAGLRPWKDRVASIWPETRPILEQIEDMDQMSLARYGHHTLGEPIGDRIVFIGDAAHATSPQLGQGANMALLDAWALGQAMRQHDDVASMLQRYAAMRRWHVRVFQFASLSLTPFYQSDSRVLAGLRDMLFDPVSRLPLARRVVAGLISGQLGRPLRELGLTYNPPWSQ